MLAHRARGDPHGADDGQHVSSGIGADGRRAARGRRRSLPAVPSARPRRQSIVGRCTAAPAALQARDLETGWNGWGAGASNTRSRTGALAGITAADAPKLKLKWVIGFAGVNSARAQPSVVGGRVFVGSESGDVLALNARTGCTYWRYHAKAGIRTAVSVGPYKGTGGSGYAVYLLRRQRDGVCRGRKHGPRALVAKARRPHLRGGDGISNAAQRPSVCAAGRRRRRRPGRTGEIRVLHVPRQRHGARREHGHGHLEVVHHSRSAHSSRQERRRKDRVGTLRRRRMGRADDRSRAPRDLHHHRQQLLRSGDADERRGDRDGSRDRNASLGVPADDE